MWIFLVLLLHSSFFSAFFTCFALFFTIFHQFSVFHCYFALFWPIKNIKNETCSDHRCDPSLDTSYRNNMFSYDNHVVNVNPRRASPFLNPFFSLCKVLTLTMSCAMTSFLYNIFLLPAEAFRALSTACSHMCHTCLCHISNIQHFVKIMFFNEEC